MDKDIKRFIKNYWNFYLRLEDDFFATLKYVEFDKKNYNTFSLEYLKLYLSVCSEIDVIGKVFAKKKNNTFECKNADIYKWWINIQDELVENKLISEIEVNFGDIEKIVPWKNFKVERNLQNRIKLCDKKKVPDWWSSYNKVKHNRMDFFDQENKASYEKANFYNLLKAFAGLFVLENSYLKKYATDDELKCLKKSKLFQKESKIYIEAESDSIIIDNFSLE